MELRTIASKLEEALAQIDSIPECAGNDHDPLGELDYYIRTAFDNLDEAIIRARDLMRQRGLGYEQ